MDLITVVNFEALIFTILPGLSSGLALFVVVALAGHVVSRLIFILKIEYTFACLRFTLH